MCGVLLDIQFNMQTQHPGFESSRRRKSKINSLFFLCHTKLRRFSCDLHFERYNNRTAETGSVISKKIQLSIDEKLPVPSGCNVMYDKSNLTHYPGAIRSSGLVIDLDHERCLQKCVDLDLLACCFDTNLETSEPVYPNET